MTASSSGESANCQSPFRKLPGQEQRVGICRALEILELPMTAERPSHF
jgi:hypothetical protein